MYSGVQKYVSLVRDALPAKLQPQNRPNIGHQNVPQIQENHYPSGSGYDRAPRNLGAPPIPPSATLKERPKHSSSGFQQTNTPKPPTSELEPSNGDKYEPFTQVGHSEKLMPIGAERNASKDAGVPPSAAPILDPPHLPPAPPRWDRSHDADATGYPTDDDTAHPSTDTGHLGDDAEAPMVMESIFDLGVLEPTPVLSGDSEIGFISKEIGDIIHHHCLLGQRVLDHETGTRGTTSAAGGASLTEF